MLLSMRVVWVGLIADRADEGKNLSQIYLVFVPNDEGFIVNRVYIYL